VAGSGSKHAPERKAFSLAPYAYADARVLADALDLAEPVAVTLVRRGYGTVEAARAFLDAAEDHDPFEFDRMADVVARLRAAIEAGARITVHGDYDVDGVCATAILVRSLRELGGDCDWYIPDRLGDGYGLTVAGVEALVARGTRLILTVDCGIGCCDEVAAARAAGLEVIVTDHHQPSPELPDCPILHPAVSGYPCAELCAAGVAYKLAAALRGPEAVEAELDLVALATVADLVPLRGENRALVRRGLAEARRARRPGMRALIGSAGARAERLDEGDIAFRLAPRINAAGRLYRADAGVELMLTEDGSRAERIAAELERANHERRSVEAEVLEGAERALRELPAVHADAPALVLAGEGWHPGVVGIVASRLAERHWRPVVLVALDGARRGRGSGRSIPGFDLLAGLRACEQHLIRYGGHRAAAGVELEAKRLDDFREAFVDHAAQVLDRGDLIRTEAVDAVVGGESLGHDVAEQLARLAPFGRGNPGVRLLVPGATIADISPMGEGGRHARFSLRCGARGALGVAFGVNGELEAAAAEPHDVSVRLELNEWNGAVTPRVVLNEIYPPEPDRELQPSRAGGDPVEVLPRIAGQALHSSAPSGSDCGAPGAPDEAEFWRRFDVERAADLAEWPPTELRAAASEAGSPGDGGTAPRSAARREILDRRGGSGVAAVAALASSGETVLVLCADALRRRELVTRAVRPARFGAGGVALASSRLSLERGREAVDRLHTHGSGVALADWSVLAAQPALADDFAHVVVVDPSPFAHLDALAAAGAGYLHLLWRPGDTELALRALAEEWPGRGSLGHFYRTVRRQADDRGTLSGARAHATLSGAGRPYPRSPESAARRLRVLEELGIVRWNGCGADRELGVVSSGATDLERSGAFNAYRRRHQEGERYLSAATQSSS
jgi:single-stranded-DNA-specific exonuclease